MTQQTRIPIVQPTTPALTRYQAALSEAFWQLDIINQALADMEKGIAHTRIDYGHAEFAEGLVRQLKNIAV